MEHKLRKAFTIACGLHIAVLVGGFALSWWLSRIEPEPLHVFELVAAAAPAPRQPQPQEEPPPEEPPVDPIQPEPLPPLPEVPPLPEQRPLPEPTPEPEPQPAPEPEPPVERISIRDFRRDRPLPQQTQTRPATSTPVPRLDPIETRVRDRLQQRLAPIRIEGVNLADLPDPDRLQAYLAGLHRRIEEVFAPTGRGLEAEATFNVSATGAIHSVRIKRSSGVAAFDRQVEQTLRNVRTPGPPPSGRDHQFSLVFRSD